MKRQACALAPEGAQVAASQAPRQRGVVDRLVRETPNRPGGRHHLPDITACTRHACLPLASALARTYWECLLALCPGGDGPPLRLNALGSPAVLPLRAALIDELVALSADPSASRRAARGP